MPEPAPERTPPDDTTPARLAEIRANDKLVHNLHGSGWDDHATDAEIDRSDLLAALDAVFKEVEENDGAVRLAVDLGQLEQSDMDLVLHVTDRIRKRIAAVLAGEERS